MPPTSSSTAAKPLPVPVGAAAPNGLLPPTAPASTAIPTFARPGGDADALLRTEWLLTSGTGGFAMGTALGAMSRRYHGLLIASLQPPTHRVMALKAIAETIVINPGTDAEQRIDLSCFKFRPGVLHPRGDQYLKKFEKDLTVRWNYEVPISGGGGGAPITIVKELHLYREAAAACVRYTLSTGGRAVKLLLRPLVAVRDFHALMLRDTSRDRFRVEQSGPAECWVRAQPANLHLSSSHGTFHRIEQWWNDFHYDLERERGYDYLEDLFHPGHFEIDLPAGQPDATVKIEAGVNAPSPGGMGTSVEHCRKRRSALIEATKGAIGGKDPSPAMKALICAADDFIVRRVAPPSGPLAGGPERVTVIAGYPWFADWGRDSMISLPGLFLVTGRFEEARDVLLTFAGFRRDGLIPNVFDDYTGEAHYNTVDASLWFINACCQYLRASADSLTFKRDLLPACLDIIDRYSRGTEYGIGADSDGLIFAGDPSTQLTWMDAKRDGVTFTPRHGKAVEINALWYNALASIVELATGLPNAAQLTKLRDTVGLALRTQFWNAQLGCLYDTLSPSPAGWMPQREVRPNQIFAVSLQHSALEPAQRKSVLEYVKKQLLTRHALRTLDPADSRYKGRYRGTMFVRDSAYHNGTAWPWLMGGFAEAILRVGNFSPAARTEARAVLSGIIDFIDGDCPGQLPEIFDGDDPSQPGAEPQHAGGCPAQAWSVAEPLRVLAMIEGT